MAYEAEETEVEAAVYRTVVMVSDTGTDVVIRTVGQLWPL